MVDDFPNMFMLMGPILSVAEASVQAVAEWNAFVHMKGEGLLVNEADSWMTGINMKVEGRQTRTIVRYSGTAPEYRAKCNEVAAGG